MTRLPNSQDTPPAKPSLWALSPLLVFFLLYLVISVAVQDFYAVPVPVAFTAAAIWSVAITKGKSITERVDLFSAGVANRNILMMVWIFVLAGAFAQSARDMGAIDATVRLTLHLLRDNLLLASVFIASCFISLSVGTSVGTIVALAPVAVGLAEATNVNTGMMTAIVVGGAFFGDNLSFISDTTIAATRTQGCEMKDKFRMNLLIAVLEKRAGYFFGNLDVYINIVSGITLRDTACDLAVCLSMVSSLLDCPVSDKLIAIGEVGLGGEVRSVTHLETRLREAQRVGFDTAIVPKHNLKMIDPSQFPGLKLVGVSYLREAINAIKLK